MSEVVAKLHDTKEIDDIQYALDFAALAYTSDDEPETKLSITECFGYEICQQADWKLSPLLGECQDSALQPFKLGQFFSCNIGSTQGYIAHTNNEVVLAFRGIDNVTDWIHALDVLSVPFDPIRDGGFGQKKSQSYVGCCRAWHCRGSTHGRVHRGIYNCFLDALPAIHEHIIPNLITEPMGGKKTRKSPEWTSPKRIILTGHSLGGALAVASCAYLLQLFDLANSPHTVLLVTFGQPRFGDKKFTDKLRRLFKTLESKQKFKGIRVVNHRDIVPSVPPLFHHTMNSYYHISENREVCSDPGDHMQFTMSSASVSDCWGDHLPENYVTCLREWKHRVKELGGSNQI